MGNIKSTSGHKHGSVSPVNKLKYRLRMFKQAAAVREQCSVTRCYTKGPLCLEHKVTVTRTVTGVAVVARRVKRK